MTDKNRRHTLAALAAEPLKTLQRIGNYVIDRTIGKGNFAHVKLATHEPTKTKVSCVIAVYIRVWVRVMW